MAHLWTTIVISMKGQQRTHCCISLFLYSHLPRWRSVHSLTSTVDLMRRGRRRGRRGCCTTGGGWKRSWWWDGFTARRSRNTHLCSSRGQCYRRRRGRQWRGWCWWEWLCCITCGKNSNSTLACFYRIFSMPSRWPSAYICIMTSYQTDETAEPAFLMTIHNNNRPW